MFKFTLLPGNDLVTEEGRRPQGVNVATCADSLSIGDATSVKEIGTEYEAYLHEIKTASGRTVSRQARRQRMTEEAFRCGGPLPGEQAGHLIQLDLPSKTHLALLRTAFDLAHQRGVRGMKVPGGRAWWPPTSSAATSCGQNENPPTAPPSNTSTL